MRTLIVVFLLVPLNFLFGQTRIWIEAGMSGYTTKTDAYETGSENGVYLEDFPAKKFRKISPLVGINIEQYFTYNFAFVTGIRYWHYELNTEDDLYKIIEHSFFPAGYPGDGVYTPHATWKTNYLAIPLGVSLSPQGKIYGIAAGVDLNVILKSTLNDMADTLNTRSSYNATPAQNRLNIAPFISATLKWRRISFSVRYFTFLKSLRSENLFNGVMNDAQERNAYIAPFYNTLYQSPDVRLSGFNISTAYRIF